MAAWHAALPYRGRFTAARPAALSALPLPPGPMPARRGTRPLKAWRYVLFVHPALIACVARTRVGPLRDAFWAAWDRERCVWRRGAGPAAGRVQLAPGGAHVRAPGARIELAFAETAGIECVSPSGSAYGWTRKQAPLPARARVRLGRRERDLAGHVLVDDTAAYYERHTRWLWSAGIGRTREGRLAAWNLVSGVNDSARESERTVWLDGTAFEPPPARFAADLSAVGELRFQTEAELARRLSLGLVRSDYRQPMGAFSGRLPGGEELAEGLGVMERHDAWW
ncbi:MAG TPA: DUF2804 family protein [Solirubrobacteraceae bacterium]|nr:DUF2804 family protein [Solirubrobacteraceae bacterium]